MIALCQECGAALPPDASPSRVLCSGRCRTARYRRLKVARDAAMVRNFAALVSATGTAEQRDAFAALAAGFGDVMAEALRAGLGGRAGASLPCGVGRAVAGDAA